MKEEEKIDPNVSNETNGNDNVDPKTELIKLLQRLEKEYILSIM